MVCQFIRDHGVLVLLTDIRVNLLGRWKPFRMLFSENDWGVVSGGISKSVRFYFIIM
jgi:hypothetical protein